MKTQLSEQVGKRLTAVQEKCCNVKILTFEDGSTIEIESHPKWTPAGTLGVFEVRDKSRVEVEAANMRLFAFDDDPESDAHGFFLVVNQDFWEEHGYLDDQHIGDMPSGFREAQESMFEYIGTVEEGRELLLKLGYKEEKKLLAIE